MADGVLNHWRVAWREYMSRSSPGAYTPSDAPTTSWNMEVRLPSLQQNGDDHEAIGFSNNDRGDYDFAFHHTQYCR
jgi:hypothetical protein